METHTQLRKDLDFIADALNSYWHQANTALTGKEPLGDIERANYESQQSKSSRILLAIESGQHSIFKLYEAMQTTLPNIEARIKYFKEREGKDSFNAGVFNAIVNIHKEAIKAATY